MSYKSHEVIGYHRLCAMNNILKNVKIEGERKDSKGIKKIEVNTESVNEIVKEVKKEIELTK
ncbi:MAG: hypothetical protein ACRDD7_04730 [Peptostreptococcaceae bacterium]